MNDRGAGGGAVKVKNPILGMKIDEPSRPSRPNSENSAEARASKSPIKPKVKLTALKSIKPAAVAEPVLADSELGGSTQLRGLLLSRRLFHRFDSDSDGFLGAHRTQCQELLGTWHTLLGTPRNLVDAAYLF